MNATGTVNLSQAEVKQAIIEFVERHGYSRLYTHAECFSDNVKIEHMTKRVGSMGGMSDGYDETTYHATVYVEAKKK